MILCRRPRLTTALVCLCLSIPIAAVAQQPAPPAPGQAKPPETAKPPENPQPNKQNPFEAVPLSAEPAKPQAPKPPVPGRPTLEAPKPAVEPKPEELSNTVENIEFRGARRVPQDTLRALIFTKKGDRLDPDTLRR